MRQKSSQRPKVAFFAVVSHQAVVVRADEKQSLLLVPLPQVEDGIAFAVDHMHATSSLGGLFRGSHHRPECIQMGHRRLKTVGISGMDAVGRLQGLGQRRNGLPVLGGNHQGGQQFIASIPIGAQADAVVVGLVVAELQRTPVVDDQGKFRPVGRQALPGVIAKGLDESRSRHVVVPKEPPHGLGGGKRLAGGRQRSQACRRRFQRCRMLRHQFPIPSFQTRIHSAHETDHRPTRP